MQNSKLISEKTRPDSYHKTIKCVMVGDGSVGKTCMLVSYTSDKFPTEYVPTIFENYTANVKVDHQNINLSLWDTAGQEDYGELRKLSYPQADVFIIVFAVSEKSTLENALEKWLPELDLKNQAAPKIIVGNKIDLRNEKSLKNGSHISKQEAETLITKKKCKYIECSALTQEGLKNVFEEAIRSCLGEKELQVNSKEGCCTLI